MRSLDYFILRTCERLGLRQAEFDASAFPEQIRLIAYEVLREKEEGGQ